jgi:hypothetical protein
MSNTSLHEKFVHPDAEFQPANYWFWQYIPTKNEIDIQLQEMLAAGFSTFFIQPRLAFPIELYMSEEYLDAYKYAIEQAHKLGLKAGIYDDYNWNSGHGGGLTVKGHNEFRERQLFWTSAVIRDESIKLEITEIRTLMGDTLGGPQGQWTYEGGKPLWSDWKIVRAIAYPEGHELSEDDHFEDLKKYCTIVSTDDDSCQIKVDSLGDKLIGLKFTVFIAARCITSRHINYLDKKATARFIEVGYEPYKRAVGKYFGSTVFCMFMDHPHAGFYKWKQAEGTIHNTLMFDESLIDTFEAEHVYPIENAWLSFLLPESRLTSKFRGDFFDTYGHMARENFLGQVSEWSHKNGLKFAGHELFGFLGIWGFYGGYHVVDQRTDFGGDYFGIGRYKDISTVDAYNSNPQIDAKVGDSVARANGDHGCMLEQYYFNVDPQFPGAIGHWNLTFEEMRAQALRHTFFGTKQFIFHGFYLSDQVGGDALLASSKFDFAPAINFEPWFKHFSTFAHEISRLSAFIYQSEPIAEIALLYPLSTFWAEGTNGVFGEESAVWNQALLEHGLGYDIVDEMDLSFNPSIPGRIHGGTHDYSLLILPGVQALRTIEKVKEVVDFVKTGGSLVISGSIPHATIADGESTAVKSIFEELLNQSLNVKWIENAKDVQETLADLIRSFLPDLPLIEKVKHTSGQLWSWVGLDKVDYLGAVFNDGNELTRASISFPMRNAQVECWDMRTGEIVDWSWFEEVNETTRAYIDLNPQQIACFRVGHSEQEKKFHITDCPLTVLDADKNKYTIKVIAEAGGDFKIHTDGPAGKAERTLTVPPIPKSVSLNWGWSFHLSDDKNSHPISIVSGWEQQGFSNFAGEGIYEIIFDMSAKLENWKIWDWRLEFPKVVSSAEIVLNGKTLGLLLWSPYKIVLPSSSLLPYNNHMEVKVTNTAGNHYYFDSPYHVSKFPSGLVGEPKLQPVKIIEIGN